MNSLSWHYPTTLEQTIELLRQPGVDPHGGGTGILRTGTERLRGLIDLRALPLYEFKAGNGEVEIGSGLTFSDVVQRMGELEPDDILVKALSQAASSPLRNRITIGGSIAMSPIWSDLLGPLLALEAEVIMAGGTSEIVPVSEYVADRSLRTGTLVTAVRFKPGHWRSFYHRAAATRFDYSSFTITVLAAVNERRVIEDLRLVVVGNRRKFERLRAIEERLVGRNAEDLNLSGIGAETGVQFSAKTIGSADYVRHLFGVELERSVEAAITGHRTNQQS